MPKILVDAARGKQVGIGCSARLDLACTCTNRCVGCYARYTTFLGEEGFHAEVKPYDLIESSLRKSIRYNVNKRNITVARCGMHCDPGHQPVVLAQVLRVAADEGMTLVVASKSIPTSPELFEAFKAGKHILHVSLGMKSENAPDNNSRYFVGQRYKKEGVKVVYRITEDMTVVPNTFYQKVIEGADDGVILTPMRYRGRETAEVYEVNLDNYVYAHSYYRPKFVHDMWLAENTGICGELNGKAYCVNCMVHGVPKQAIKDHVNKGDVFKGKLKGAKQ